MFSNCWPFDGASEQHKMFTLKISDVEPVWANEEFGDLQKIFSVKPYDSCAWMARADSPSWSPTGNHWQSIRASYHDFKQSIWCK